MKKKPVNFLTHERRMLLINLAAIAPGKFVPAGTRAIKSEGQGKILKLLLPTRKQVSSKTGSFFSLVVYACTHKTLDDMSGLGQKWRNEVSAKLAELGGVETLSIQHGSFTTETLGFEPREAK